MTGPVLEATAALVAVAFPFIAPAVVRALGDRHERRLDAAAYHRWTRLHAGRDHQGTGR